MKRLLQFIFIKSRKARLFYMMFREDCIGFYSGLPIFRADKVTEEARKRKC